MKLTINLRDREEIEQAVYLLQRELDRCSNPVDGPRAPESELEEARQMPAPDDASLPVLGGLACNVVPLATDLDSAGQSWDARVHASSRAKNTDGTWRKRRGVAEAPPAPAEQTAWPFPPPTDMTFAQLMAKLTAAVTKGILTPERINAACVKNGAASVVGLQTNPEAIPAVWADLVALVPEIAE